MVLEKMSPTAVFVAVLLATALVCYGLERVLSFLSLCREIRWGLLSLLSYGLLRLSYFAYFTIRPVETGPTLLLNGIIIFYTLLMVVFGIMAIYALVWRYLKPQL